MELVKKASSVNIEGNTLAMNVEKGNVVKNKSNPRDSCNLIIYNEIEKLEQERRKALTASKLDVNLYLHLKLSSS